MVNDFTPRFRQIAASQAELRLLNLFQGLPIAYSATVQAVSGQSICVRTEKYQIVCLYREKETYLQSNLLPAILKAQVVALDIPRREAFLSDFEPIHGQIGDRTQVRIHLNGQIPSEVQSNESPQTFQGELADLSHDGFAIYIPRRYFYPRLYSAGAEISVLLHLPEEGKLPERHASLTAATHNDPMARFDRQSLRLAPLRGPTAEADPDSSPRRKIPSAGLEIHGRVANVIAEPGHERVRIGLRIPLNDPARPVIARLISKRQSEIIREIKELSELLS